MSNITSNDSTSGEANTPRNSAFDTAVDNVVQQLNETFNDDTTTTPTPLVDFDSKIRAEQSLLRKLSSSIKSTGIVVFKNAGNYEDMKRSVIEKSLQISRLCVCIISFVINISTMQNPLFSFLGENRYMVHPPLLSTTPDGESASERIDRYLRNEISYTELIDYGIPDFYFDKTGDSITIVPSLLRTTMVIVHQILRFAIPSRFLQNANFKDHNGQQKNILKIFKELK
eukprot:g762.t1